MTQGLVSGREGLVKKYRGDILRVGAPIVLCVLVALSLFWASPTFYSAESRLSVGDQGVAAAQVPGYVEAAKSLASDYARYVQLSPVIVNSVSQNDGGEVFSVSASPIPESNVVRVEAQASTPGGAVRAASLATQGLVEQVEQSRPDVEAARIQFVDAYKQFVTARSAADGVASRADAAALNAASNAATLDLQQQALGAVYRDAFSDAAKIPRLQVFSQPQLIGTDSVAKFQRFVLIALVAGVALGGLLVAYSRGYMDRFRGQSGSGARANVEKVRSGEHRGNVLDAATEPGMRFSSAYHSSGREQSR